MLQCGRRLAGLAGTASRQQLVGLGGASTRLYHENVGPTCRMCLLLLGDVFQAQCVFACGRVTQCLFAHLCRVVVHCLSVLYMTLCIVRAGD